MIFGLQIGLDKSESFLSLTEMFIQKKSKYNYLPWLKHFAVRSNDVKSVEAILISNNNKIQYHLPVVKIFTIFDTWYKYNQYLPV